MAAPCVGVLAGTFSVVHTLPRMSALATLQAALAGKYEIERELGRGGMAIVYLATEARHGRRVAHAHRHGAVHRDLKPENILLRAAAFRSDGTSSRRTDSLRACCHCNRRRCRPSISSYSVLTDGGASAR